MMLSSKRLGLLFSFAYCLMNVFSTTLISVNSLSIAPYKLIFYNVFMLIVFLHIKNLINPDSTRISTLHAKNLCKLNISAAISWITAIYSLTLIHPIIFISLMFGLLPAFTLILETNKKESVSSKIDNYFANLLLGISGLIATIYLLNCWLSRACLLDSNCFRNMSIGILLVFVSSFCTASNNLLSKQLNNDGMSSHKILLYRYLLLFLISFISIIFMGIDFLPSNSELTIITIISFSYVIIPMLLMHAAIRYSNPTTFAFVIPLQSAIIFFLQQNQLAPHSSIFLNTALFLLSSLIVLVAMQKIKKECQ